MWDEIPAHFGHVRLDAFVVMPNHVHGVLWIGRGGSGNPAGEAVPSPLQLGQAGELRRGARRQGVERLNTMLHVGERMGTRLPVEIERPAIQHLDEVFGMEPGEAAGPVPGSVGAIVGSFKSASARRINDLRATPGGPVWQRNYYEHVIRAEEKLDLIRCYIQENPERWADDRYNPDTAQSRRVGE